MGKKYEFRVSTGITSIMMIFVVLCLTAFGVLSYTSANADLKLTDKNSENIRNFYEAEGNANRKLCEIDGVLFDLRSKGLRGQEYYDAVKTEVEKRFGAGVYDSLSNTVLIEERISDRQIYTMTVKIGGSEEKARYTAKSAVTH